MTIIIAMAYDNNEGGGVILGADSRVTEVDEGSGEIFVRNDDSVKILKLSETTYICVAGTLEGVGSVYYAVRNILRAQRRMDNTFSVREIASTVLWALTQAPGKNVVCIVGGWDAEGGPQIYGVVGSEMTGSLEYCYEGSGSSFLCEDDFVEVENRGFTKERAEQKIMQLLKKAIASDPESGGQIYTVTIDKTAAVKEVVLESGEVLENWGWK